MESKLTMWRRAVLSVAVVATAMAALAGESLEVPLGETATFNETTNFTAVTVHGALNVTAGNFSVTNYNAGGSRVSTYVDLGPNAGDLGEMVVSNATLREYANSTYITVRIGNSGGGDRAKLRLYNTPYLYSYLKEFLLPATATTEGARFEAMEIGAGGDFLCSDVKNSNAKPLVISFTGSNSNRGLRKFWNGDFFLMPGGDIILKRGITGAGRGKVSARGNVFSDFIEHAKVEAGQDVYANSIINSEILTNGNVIVSGKQGYIIGGNTHGLRGIVANAAGSQSEVRTVLHAGFQKEDYTRFLQLEQKEKRIAASLEQIIDDLTSMLKARAKAGSVNKAQRENILAVNRKRDSMQEELKSIRSDKEDIARKMSMGGNASIIIRGDVYRNVLISIDAARLAILKEETYVRYVCRNDEIQRRAIPRE